MSRIKNGVEEVSYTWDKENRLIGVRKANGEVISYGYDSDGIRVSSTVNGVKTEYLVDKNLPYAQVLEERVNNGLTAGYVYGNDLISQQRGSEKSFYLVDGLGSTRGLTNGSGVVTDRYSYDGFGNLIGSGGNTENNYLFAGEQFDKNLGDYYLRQRYYDTDTGRFTRRDSYEGSIGEPVTLHKYLYANANPVNFIDPTGLFTLSEISTAQEIRNTLAGIQTESYSYLISSTLRRGEYGFGEFLSDLSLNAAVSVFAILQYPLSFSWLDDLGGGGGGSISAGRGSSGGGGLPRFTYRGDSRPPEEIFEAGLQPRNPGGNITLFEHVNGINEITGATVDLRRDSQWVSTSLNANSAKGFANDDFQGGFVYIVRPRMGSDVNATFGISSSEHEFAVLGGIPPQDILGVRRVGDDDKFTGKFIPNPKFIK
nr:RHS repeat-associated core domain-containing protein [Argonema antarcticum]